MLLGVKRSLSFVAVGAVMALLLGPATLASGPKPETTRLNAADQAAARAVVVRRADLQPASGWMGGSIKPESIVVNCPYYHPDLSRFVTTGQAASRWSRKSSGLIVVTTEASVSQTARMQREELRIQLQPAAVRCGRSIYSKQATAAGVTLISFERVSFPHIATYSAAFEARVRWVGPNGQDGRSAGELVFLGQGRTAITLVVSGPQSARASLV